MSPVLIKSSESSPGEHGPNLGTFSADCSTLPKDNVEYQKSSNDIWLKYVGVMLWPNFLNKTNFSEAF